MLQIVSSTVVDGQTGVYLNQAFEVTFNFELHQSSLTADNFKLYVMPGFSGFIPLSITKQGPKVILVPQVKLNPNSQYALWIKGDKNISDNVYEGVASIVGDVMDKNQIINFTTGTKTIEEAAKPPPTIGGYDIVTPDGTPITSVEQVTELLAVNKMLDVIRTYPKNDATNVPSGTQLLTVVFDQEIAPVVPDLSGSVEIAVIPLDFNDEPPAPEILNVSISGKSLLIDIDGNLADNCRYVITLHRETIIGIKKESLPEDYSFTFLSRLFPAFSSPYHVRFRGQKLIPPDVTDGTIMEYIHMISKWVVFHVLRYPEVPEGKPPDAIVRLVTCKVVEQMAEDILLGTMKGVTEKALGDFRIRYSEDAVRRLLFNISERCIKEALIEMGLSGAKTSVKSKYSTRRPYPNGKRIIHTYFRGGTYYRTGLARAYVPPDILI